MKRILIVWSLALALSADAAYVRFTLTDISGSAQTNAIRVTPVGQPTVNGVRLVAGLPVRIPTTNGVAVRSLELGNYSLELIGVTLSTNFYFSVPEDSTTNIYDAVNLRVSGGNFFNYSGRIAGILDANHLTNWARIPTNAMASSAGRTNWALTEITNSGTLSFWTSKYPTNLARHTEAFQYDQGVDYYLTLIDTVTGELRRTDDIVWESAEQKWRVKAPWSVGGPDDDGEVTLSSSGVTKLKLSAATGYLGDGAGLTNIPVASVVGAYPTSNPSNYVALGTSTNLLEITDTNNITYLTISSVGLSLPGTSTNLFEVRDTNNAYAFWIDSDLKLHGDGSELTGIADANALTNNETRAVVFSNSVQAASLTIPGDETNTLGSTTVTGYLAVVGDGTNVLGPTIFTGNTNGFLFAGADGVLTNASITTDALTNNETRAVTFSNSVQAASITIPGDETNTLGSTTVTGYLAVTGTGTNTLGLTSLTNVTGPAWLRQDADQVIRGVAQVPPDGISGTLTNPISTAGTVASAGMFSTNGALIYGSSAQTNALYVGPPGVISSNAAGSVVMAGGKIGIDVTPTVPLQIGTGADIAGADNTVAITRAINASGSGSAHGFIDNADISRGGGIGYSSFQARHDWLGSNSFNHNASFQDDGDFDGSGTLTNWWSFLSGLTIYDGLVKNRYGFYVDQTAVVGGGVEQQYGLYIENLTSGSVSNYAVFAAGTTPSYFGGAVDIGGAGSVIGKFGVGTKAPTSKMEILGVGGAVSGAAAPDWSNDALAVINNLATAINIITPSTLSGNIFFSDNVRARGRLTYNHADDSLQFWTADNERGRFSSSGAFSIANTINATNGYAVGAATGIDKTFTLYTKDEAGTGTITNTITITKGIITGWTP